MVLPAYNREDLLGSALESIARQRPWAPDEVIVVDDASSDGTAALASRWGATVLRHDENRGAAAARNTAIKAARHPWVALLDSDDVWLPGHLGRIWAARGNHVLVASAALSRGEEGPRLVGHPSRRPVVLDRASQLVFPENFVPASGVLVRRDAVIEAGMFPQRVFGEDAELWTRVLELGTGLVLPEPGYWYTRHPSQATGDRAAARAARAALWAGSSRSDASIAAADRRLQGVVLWDQEAGRPPVSRLLRWIRRSNAARIPSDTLPRLLAWRFRQRRRLRDALVFAAIDEAAGP